MDAQISTRKIIRSERPLDPGTRGARARRQPPHGREPSRNGGRVLKALDLPDFAHYALEVPGPGEVVAEAPRKLGEYLRDIIKLNPANFRLFCPDETNSNRLNAVFEATNRCTMEPTVSIDDHLAPDGRVMEVLSEHLCEGWLEGYLLTGRHGMWSSYEAFAQVVDSMVTQHAKWLEQCIDFPWRRPLASLNVFITSHAWRNDHNGFSHQAPGFVDNVLQRRSEVVRVYYPPDANCLLNVFDHCLRSRNYVNVVTCGKQPQLQWLTFDEALAHCSQGASIWNFATNDGGDGAGHRPGLRGRRAHHRGLRRILAAAEARAGHKSARRERGGSVALMSPDDHPHGMDNISFEALFTSDVDVVFAFHGYRWLIHSMVHGRANEAASMCAASTTKGPPPLRSTWWC